MRIEELECCLTPSNTINTIAGTGTYGYSGDGGPATFAMIQMSFGDAIDSNGNVYFADAYNQRVREIVKSTGTLITVAGKTHSIATTSSRMSSEHREGSSPARQLPIRTFT
jgi:hypothetical protein